MKQSNYRWQNHKERQNRSANNGDLDVKANHLVRHISNYRKAELLKN